MQSYDNISPTLGNLLSILIVIGGAVGVILAKFVIFPKIIKNEITACFVMMAFTIPFAFVLSLIGKVSVWSIVLSLAMMNLSLTATNLFVQYYNMYFIKYGKNGTAAGIINSAASLGMALQFCIFGPVAENLGWKTVAVIWIVMTAVAIFFLAVALPYANRFKKENT